MIVDSHSGINKAHNSYIISYYDTIHSFIGRGVFNVLCGFVM